MLEMLDSGPFLKLGVGWGDTDQFGATRTRKRKGSDRGGSASGEEDQERATKLGAAAGLEPRKEGPACWTQGKGKVSSGFCHRQEQCGGTGSLHSPSRLKVRSHHTPYLHREQGEHPFSPEECLGSFSLASKNQETVRDTCPHIQDWLREHLPLEVFMRNHLGIPTT